MSKKVLLFVLIILPIITIISIIDNFEVNLPLHLDYLSMGTLKVTTLLLFCFTYYKLENEVSRIGIILVLISFILGIMTKKYYSSDFLTFLYNINKIISTVIGFLYYLSIYSLMQNSDVLLEKIKNGASITYILRIIMLIILTFIVKKEAKTFRNIYYSLGDLETLLSYGTYALFLFTYNGNNKNSSFDNQIVLNNENVNSINTTTTSQNINVVNNTATPQVSQLNNTDNNLVAPQVSSTNNVVSTPTDNN